MEKPDLNYLKTIVRSLLTSSQSKMTISQILNEYLNYEGCNLPYKHLGFKTIFELLENMKDVLKIPLNPNMNSFITLVVDEKISHLRELVVNQKPKRQRPRRNNFSERNGNNQLLKSANIKSRGYNYNNHRTEYSTSRYEYSTPRRDNSARGYDHVKIKSLNSKPIGTVTPNLKSFIENLCKTSGSQIITINKLKNCLINHPDYKKLGTTNIEESINMLKYFIYIDKGGVHLKDSPFEIFPSKTSDKRKYAIPTSVSYLSSIVNENEEMLYSEQCDDDFNEMDDFDTENFNIYGLNDSKSKNNDTVPAQNNDKNILISYNTKPVPYKIVSKIEQTTNSGIKNLSKMEKDDCKKAIVAIIARSKRPITVKTVLEKFKNNHGFTFPFQTFSCRSCMDFFRLYPDIFKLEEQCSTNSVVSLEKQIILKPKGTIRKYLKPSSIFNNVAVTNSENNIFNLSMILSELLPNKDNDQKFKDSTTDNSSQPHCEKSIHLNKIYDADTILDTMKVKMRNILSKHKDGILCNDFMNVYGNEYNSHFSFSEYGFSSMRDMAYKLPSVFYVKLTADNQDSLLFEADRRSELENNSDDPSLYYKNIPNTVLFNLSKFFNKYRNGVKFNELMTLYCSEYGRAYEPLKYGYSSEKHMFESLDKMVEIADNKVFTINPFVYTKDLKNIDHTDNYNQDSVVIPDSNFLLHYSGDDICNGKFKYPNVKLNKQKCINVIVAEIYNPSSFYIQLAAEVNNLNSLMDSLQMYYNDNEKKYKILPSLILPELACTSCFEDSGSWHRAKVLKIIDDNYVQLLYVDYGSIEKVQKTNVRLLASQFGAYPAQGVYCGLYKYNELNYPRDISEYFAEMVEDQLLEAEFHPPISEGGSQKVTVTLFLNTKNNKININKKCSKEIINNLNKHQGSIRRTIYKVTQEKNVN